MDHKIVIEAALFLSPKPMALDELGKLIATNSLGYVKELLVQLTEDYKDRGIEIVSLPEGWLMQVRADLLPTIAHLAPHADLSEGDKRTLALIVFKEPARQSEIVKIQGNKAYGYIHDLQKKGLIKIEPWGRTKKLTLTPEFERYFGSDKISIKERVQQELAVSKERWLKEQAQPDESD
ncbi:MAG: SMC-Scp complex subunit ScpB [Nanoarchaeota archaeon]|nr:SMC-Scp complex subunit ScpB [Nanoarchaeota archaeon]